MWRFPDWPFTRASAQHQIDVMVAMLLKGIDPERFHFYDDPEPLLATAREIAAGE
jgi:hypothetical protein